MARRPEKIACTMYSDLQILGSRRHYTKKDRFKEPSAATTGQIDGTSGRQQAFKLSMDAVSQRIGWPASTNQHVWGGSRPLDAIHAHAKAKMTSIEQARKLEILLAGQVFQQRLRNQVSSRHGRGIVMEHKTILSQFAGWSGLQGLSRQLQRF